MKVLQLARTVCIATRSDIHNAIRLLQAVDSGSERLSMSLFRIRVLVFSPYLLLEMEFVVPTLLTPAVLASEGN